MKKFIPLTKDIIKILEKNNCQAENWKQVKVSANFNPELVTNLSFMGKVCIGALNKKKIIYQDQKTFFPALKNVIIKNCEIGDDCFITNIHGIISDTIIGDYSYINNCGNITCQEKNCFGNGSIIKVQNEGAARDLILTQQTSAQTAYLNVFYKHDKALTSKLEKIQKNEVLQYKSDYNQIGSNVYICNTAEMNQVRIGDYAYINNAAAIINATINSEKEAPAIIKHNVFIKNSIIQKSSIISEGSILTNSLAGEGVTISKHFSAENSVFFANSEMFHSEACSAFCGPFSISHHRGTLLLTALYSFFNAGSSTNFSNHMYKLGPVHQGIMERGCKTGSSSYIMWPARVGAFSIVIGKHHSHFDTTEFPFSYIIEKDGASFLLPGAVIGSCGLLRDQLKWNKREMRKTANMLDLVHTEIFSPYTAEKIFTAVQQFNKIIKESGQDRKIFNLNGIKINSLQLKAGLKYYKTALYYYFGSVIFKKLQKSKNTKFDQLINKKNSSSEWLDICGMLCSKKHIIKILSDIKNEKISDYKKLHFELKKIYSLYENDEWQWICSNFKKLLQLFPLTKNENIYDINLFFNEFIKESKHLYQLNLLDAEKDFSKPFQVSYDIDDFSDLDFEIVRGNKNQHQLINYIKQKMKDLNTNTENKK